MFEAFLVTTSSEGLRALGQKEQRSFELIVDVVRDRLTEAHARLFAEPVPTKHGDQYDWYAPISGKAERLSNLDDERRSIAQARLDTLVAGIVAESARLKSGRSLDDLRLGEALENAVRVPSDDFVYVIDTPDGVQPVLVSWAWISDEQRAVRGVLTGTERHVAAPIVREEPIPAEPQLAIPLAPEPVPSAVVRQKPRGLGWLWWLIGLGWLLLAIMLAAIVFLLVKPCGLVGTSWLSFCEVPAVAIEESATTLTLEAQIAALERQLADADRACQPPPPVVQEEPQQEAAVDEDLQDRMDRSGAQRGELTFTLSWDTHADLDLWVTCPMGDSISYRRRQACGGSLDVDSNAGNTRADPIENTYFMTPGAGTYQVRVNLYALKRSSGPQNFRLTIQDGDRTETVEGTVSQSTKDWSYSYNYAGQQ